MDSGTYSPPPTPAPPRRAADRARLHLLARTNLIASAVVSPIYVVVTNPLSRLEVIMQTSSMQQKSITTMEVKPPLLPHRTPLRHRHSRSP